MIATLGKILTAINVANQKLDAIMTQQDDINADVQAIDQADASLLAATTAIEAEITDLKAKAAAGQPVDLTGLDAKVASLKTAVSGVAAIAPPAAPAAS